MIEMRLAVRRPIMLKKSAGADWVGQSVNLLTHLLYPKIHLGMLHQVAPLTRANGRRYFLRFGILGPRQVIPNTLEVRSDPSAATWTIITLKSLRGILATQRGAFKAIFETVGQAYRAIALWCKNRFVIDEDLAKTALNGLPCLSQTSQSQLLENPK